MLVARSDAGRLGSLGARSVAGRPVGREAAAVPLRGTALRCSRVGVPQNSLRSLRSLRSNKPRQVRLTMRAARAARPPHA